MLDNDLVKPMNKDGEIVDITIYKRSTMRLNWIEHFNTVLSDKGFEIVPFQKLSLHHIQLYGTYIQALEYANHPYKKADIYNITMEEIVGTIFLFLEHLDGRQSINNFKDN